MIIPIRGIVLQTIRHNDSSDIVTLFTEQRGRMSFVLRAGSSRSGRIRRARLSPLAIVETEVNFRANKDLQILGEISTPHPWRNLYFDPMKGAMTIFLAEFLNKVLRTTEADLPIWNYLLYAINSLDILERGIANYHIAFLTGLLPFVGIAPDLRTYREGSCFDMQAGVFEDLTPAHRNVILPAEAAVIPQMLRMNFRNMSRYRLNVGERRHLLYWMMRYYSVHLPVDDNMRSLEVLQEVFG